ncbi:MAG TPA: DUF6263 family protein [Hanamia sp.]|nr:DUF6263 family protein [Hanamia sp.]
MKKISVLVVAAMCSSMALLAQSNASLNLKKGQKYVVENKISTKSSTEMQGQQMEADVDATTSYNIEVKDEVANNYNLTNTITNLKMNMTQMGQEMTFDSDKKDDLNGPIGSSLKDFINQPKAVVIDKSGKVIQEKKEQKADDASSMMAKQLGNFEATGFGADMAFEALPQNVKVGSTWTNKTDADGISKTTNYTVKAINGKLATIGLEGTLATDTKMEMQGMEITTKTTGTFAGEEIVDITTGVVQSNNLTTDAKGIVGVMGQELPTSSKVTSATTVKMM